MHIARRVRSRQEGVPAQDPLGMMRPRQRVVLRSSPSCRVRGHEGRARRAGAERRAAGAARGARRRARTPSRLVSLEDPLCATRELVKSVHGDQSRDCHKSGFRRSSDDSARVRANSHPRSGPLAPSTSHARGERRRTQQSSAAVRVHISHVSRRVASVTDAGAGAGDAIGPPPSSTLVF